MGGKRATTRSTHGRSENSPSQERDEDPEEALRWIAGHCRFVATQLPRGEVGVSFAASLLAAIPGAVRRRVPDLTGTVPDLFASAHDYGLLAEVPSARVMRAVPRMVAARSPIFEPRSKRCWTLWLVHLLDPPMLAKIRRLTPASQLEVCAPAPRSRTRSRGELSGEVRALGEALAAERAATSELRRRVAALERELAEKSAALGHVLQDAARQAERLRGIEGEGAALRELRSRHADLQRAYDEQAGEQAPLRGEVEDLRGQLRRALEINNQLYERLEAAGIVGLAGGLLSSILQQKPKKG